MPATIGLVIAFVIAGIGALALQLRESPRVEPGLCWSCGSREQHKLWCPNR